MSVTVGEVSWGGSGHRCSPDQRSDRGGLVNVLESAHGERDPSGDEDSSDSIVHLYDLKSRRTMNLRCSGFSNRTFHMPSAERVALIVSETDETEDLNGDGDLEDHVLCFFSLRPGIGNPPGLLALLVAHSRFKS